jgi:quercetin dioxygenase-like cupin family protein
MAERKIIKEYDVHSYTQYMWDKFSAYDGWVKDQGIPVLSGSFVDDAREVELGDWELRGAKGALLSFSDQRVADGYIMEIPPAGDTKPHRQLYEEIIVILEGRGSTELWYEEGQKRSFEWQRGSVFSVPINAAHRHLNGSGKDRVRYVALTSAPPVIEFFRDRDFIFNNTHVFPERFDPRDPEFFGKEPEYLTEYYGGILDTNFISDIRKIQLVAREARGKGNKNMYIHIAGATMFAHVSRFPVGTYKKAHRHGPGAHIVMLDSTGYTMMWKDGEEPTRYDWAEGSVISPPAGVWHQHYNTGTEPCKFVALHASFALASGGKGGGVEQLESSELDEGLREIYVAECEKNGIEVNV